MNRDQTFKEFVDEYTLQHHGIKGMKKGIRRWQNEDGSYTPEGRIHYGIGDGKEERPKEKDDVEKRTQTAIERFRERRKAKAEERDERNKKLAEEKKQAREMSDEDLNARIDRLQREKRYADLVAERNAREQSEFSKMTHKLLSNAAENLAKQSLTLVVDKIISKAKAGMNKDSLINLADYKDVDIYSIPSDKIAAIASAFQTASQLASNRRTVNNNGNNDNNQNNQNNNSNKQNNKPNDNSGKQDTSGSNQNNQGATFSKNQRKKMRSLASSGMSAAEIAKKLGVSESTVQQYAGEQLKKDNSSSNAKAETKQDTAPASPDKETIAKNNQKYMDVASKGRKDATKRNDDLQKMLDQIDKSQAPAVSKAEMEERLKNYSKWLSDDAWEETKKQVRAEAAEQERRKAEEKKKQEEEARRRKVYAQFGYRY